MAQLENFSLRVLQDSEQPEGGRRCRRRSTRLDYRCIDPASTARVALRELSCGADASERAWREPAQPQVDSAVRPRHEGALPVDHLPRLVPSCFKAALWHRLPTAQEARAFGLSQKPFKGVLLAMISRLSSGDYGVSCSPTFPPRRWVVMGPDPVTMRRWRCQ